MHRELNPPDEIFRRVIFVMYLGGWLGSGTLLILGIVRSQLGYLAVGLLIAGANMYLRRYGKTHLEFDRLSKSFPLGTKEDEIPAQLRAELQNILHKYQDNNTNWVVRQELRDQLADLINREPLILEAYSSQIHAIHPRLKQKRHTSPGNLST